MIRIIIILISAFTLLYSNTFSQCNVTAYGNGGTTQIQICLGDIVTLTATGGCPNYVLNNDFNDGTPGTGWSATNQAMFNNPCAPHSPDGTIYLWMGSTSTAPRNITTVDFDVSMGGDIQFEMRYAVQGAASPCEGPDLYNEGIAVQYSTNGGSTWNTIEYYAPNGDVLTFIPTGTSPGVSAGVQTPFTVWTTRLVPIPPAAQTTSTRFRWAQTISTSNVYDHWGLDNVSILVPPPTIEVWWSHGATGYTPGDVNPTQNTTYTVYLTDGNDTVQSSVDVIVNPIPTSDFTVTSPVCVGNPATVTYTGSAAAGANYSWNFAGGTVLSGSGQGPYQVFWQNPGTHNIELTLIENGCQSITTSNPVLVNPKPTPPNISYNPPCMFDDFQQFADTIPGAIYSWTGPGGFSSNQQNPIINNIETANAGTYSLFITDVNGCVSDIVSHNVTILNLPNVSFSGSPISGCVPLTVNFSNTTPAADAFFWEFGDNAVDNTGASPVHTYTQPGSYDVTLTVTDNNGCTNTQTNNAMITVHHQPVAGFTTNPEVGAPNFDITFNSAYTTPGGTWYWNFGDGTPTDILNVPTTVHAYTNMGTYTVEHIVESEFGCKDTIVKTILVINISIPNVFTPNGDGINDNFVIEGIDQIKDTQIVVYNRWGKKVYENNDYKNDWDGDGLADGVYYFVITFKDNLFETANGTVTILR